MASEDDPINEENADGLDALFAARAEAVNTGDVKAIRTASRNIFQHISATSPGEPSPWLAAMTEAHHCEAVFDWAGAEAAYQQGVDVTADSPMGLYGAYRQLSAFYRLCGRYDAALDAAKSATQAARRMGTPMMVPIALHIEAVTHLRMGDHDAASDAVADALAVIGDGPRYDLHRVLVLTARADCLLGRGQYADAQANLQTAWEWVAPWAEESDAGGWQSALAGWWTATARLRAKQGDSAGAVAAWREAVARCRLIASVPHLAGPYANNHLALTLTEFGKALAGIDDPAATEAFDESHALRLRIGLAPPEK